MSEEKEPSSPAFTTRVDLSVLTQAANMLECKCDTTDEKHYRGCPKQIINENKRPRLLRANACHEGDPPDEEKVFTDSGKAAHVHIDRYTNPPCVMVRDSKESITKKVPLNMINRIDIDLAMGGKTMVMSLCDGPLVIVKILRADVTEWQWTYLAASHFVK